MPVDPSNVGGKQSLEELMAWQESLEDESYRKGAEIFWQRLNNAEAKGRATAVKGGTRKLLRKGMASMVAAIEDMIQGATGSDHGGRQHTAVKWCKLVGPEVAAYLTLKVVLDMVGQAKSSTGSQGKVSSDLGDVSLAVFKHIRDEIRYTRFRKLKPSVFKYKLASWKHSTSYTFQARSLNASMSYHEIPEWKDLAYLPQHAMRVGAKLISMLIETTGIVEKRTVYLKTNKTRIRASAQLHFTSDTLAWLRQYDEGLSLLQPLVVPMVVPPLSWGPGKTGGYRYALRGQFAFVRRASAGQQEILKEAPLPQVYDAVNTIQNTAWRINTKVLDTIRGLQAMGGGIAGVPPVGDLPMPAKPFDIDTNADARKVWRNTAGKIKDENVVRRINSLDFERLLTPCNTLKDAPAIWFPYFLDFRGRIYPISSHLSPQGRDVAKALLEFADGKVLTRDGAKWLAIHGANCLGKTPEGRRTASMTLDERIDWIVSHSERIVAAAKDPCLATWWAEADDPLSFLAFCFEWHGAIQAHEKGEHFVSRLPCSMDGTCNGLQHFAALLKDEKGGKYVNVSPSDRPEDVYEVVRLAVLDRVEKDAALGSLEATKWLGLHNSFGIIDRKLAKTPTMTFVYGSRRYGFGQFISNYVRDHDSWHEIKGVLTDPGEKRPALAPMVNYLSGVVWESLQGITTKAFEAMEWMQNVSKGITSKNSIVRWTVPCTDFPAEQAYYQPIFRRVNTVLAGETFAPSVVSDSNKVHKQRSHNAIAPNVIHSLDAACAMMTVNLAAGEGVEQFRMIHDSFGALASDCEVLARATRQAFAKLYMSRDVLSDLAQDFSAQWPEGEEFPAPPEKGSLDVSQVHASQYFFC